MLGPKAKLSQHRVCSSGLIDLQIPVPLSKQLEQCCCSSAFFHQLGVKVIPVPYDEIRVNARNPKAIK